jgi:hypothetical protein
MGGGWENIGSPARLVDGKAVDGEVVDDMSHPKIPNFGM